MAELLTAARPYAKALYEVVANDVNTWLPVMQICSALGQNKESRHFLNAHDLNIERFTAVIQPLLSSSGINDIPARFDDLVRVLADNKRFALLPDIADLFIKEVNKSNETITADIICAKPLTTDVQHNLVSQLEKKYGKKAEVSITIDDSLIGGAIIKIGDTVIDGSIKGRLEQLTKALN
ncbi:MAG: F0F1 ATP synthase subunit delta [Ostreibacterium sp.]